MYLKYCMNFKLCYLKWKWVESDWVLIEQLIKYCPLIVRVESDRHFACYWYIWNTVQNREKIYLQGNLAGRRRADEASSAQYLRWFWQGFFVKMLTSTQNCAEIWSWPLPSSRNPMTQWLLIPNYYKKFIFWWNLWKR